MTFTTPGGGAPETGAVEGNLGYIAREGAGNISKAVNETIDTAKAQPGGLEAGFAKIAPKAEEVVTKAEAGIPQAKKTLNQVLEQYANINLKRDVPITDIYGAKSVIPQGEAITPYNLGGNKILLKDGVETVVNKNQFENIKGNAVSGEAKPFAPELQGTTETIKSGKMETLPGGATLRTETSQPKYSQYTLPGGENYREVLIQAPEVKVQTKGYNIEQGVGDSQKYFHITDDFKRRVQSGFDSKAEAQAWLNAPENKAFLEKNKEFAPIGQQFKSAHWEEPNVISHVRLNDRVTPDGKPVTFMETVGS